MSSKRPAKTYDILTFVASTMFPPSNPLAMDILRLMAAYNDLSEILDWMIGTRAVVSKRIAWKRARVRMSIQNRLLLGLLHEAFVVFDNMQGTPEFKALEQQGHLSERGKRALTTLRQAHRGSDEVASMRSRLSLCRNRVAFHYDRDSFEAGTTMFGKMFVNKDRAESQLLYGEERAYFYYAEQVREIVAFGFNDKDGDSQIAVKLGKYLTDAKTLTQAMGQFLDEVFAAYSQLNNLDSGITLVSVKE